MQINPDRDLDGVSKEKTKQFSSTEGHSTVCFDLIFLHFLAQSIIQSFYFLKKKRWHKSRALRV